MNLSAKIVLTASDRKFLLTEISPDIISTTEHISSSLTILPQKNFQTLLGFGGAFTEAMGYTLQQIPEKLAQEALEAYFHPETGIGYNFCRTHMNSCDFSLGNYACVEKSGDVELESFSIERERKYLVPMIQEASRLRGGDLKMFFSPWSPPAWMKTNGRMNNGGSLKKEYYPVWARYFVKFIEAFENEGIPFWGLTLQNEPLAITPWDNCNFTHAQERELLKEVSRALKSAGYSDKKIIVWDHNKDVIKERADVIFSDLEAYEATYGIGFHWYGPTDNESSIDDTSLDYLHTCYPDKKLIFTEGCNPLYGAPNYFEEWWTGEKYGHHIIEDLNNHTAAWIDWNMVLDEKGGPNHVNNFCDAPIIADAENRKLHYQSPYYYIGHFSRYIKPGAVRLGSSWEKPPAQVYSTIFRNPSGEIVTVVMNKGDAPAAFRLKLEKYNYTLKLPAHSICTITI